MTAINLQKKSEQIDAILLSKGIRQAPVMRVGVALDISGSMSGIIGRGDLQKAFDQMMGVSVKFDDNGELDVFKFDTSCEYVGTSTPEVGDYDTYIKDNRISPRGGTRYGPIVDSAIDFFLKPKKKGFLGMGGSEPVDSTPVLMLVLTDGEPSDASGTLKALEKTTSQPIYWHFVGIGGNGRSSFPTIAHLADELPNVGEVYLKSFDLPDSEVYEQLICDELIEFISQFVTPVRAGARG